MDNKGKYFISDELEAEIEKRFSYHSPFGDQPIRYTVTRSKALELAWFLCENCPESRERALALTNLEQAIFWANAAIARNEEKEEE